jgi:hypothetical protein
MAYFAFHYMLVPALTAGLLFLLFERTWGRRVRALEDDLQRFSDAMFQMAEIQMKAYRKFSDGFGDVEERLLELSIPSRDGKLPLDRRHNVLALARKGVAVDDIAKRLSVPRGEAELILSLRKYMDSAKAAHETKPEGALKQYAQA